MVQVKQMVDRVLYLAGPSQTVAEVARQMAHKHIGAIVILDEGRLRGVFSERDLMMRVVVAGLDAENTPVERVMTTAVATVDEEDGLEQAMETMKARQCRHLPVLRGEEVVGFLSMRDLMHFELMRKTEELVRMRAYIHGVA